MTVDIITGSIMCSITIICCMFLIYAISELIENMTASNERKRIRETDVVRANIRQRQYETIRELRKAREELDIQLAKLEG